MKSVTIKGRSYKLPIYLPDATKGVTKSIDVQDLVKAGIEGVVVNTYHLMNSPGIKVLKEFNGIKSFMNFSELVVSDSGGWQVFSLIRRNGRQGKIEDKGVTFLEENKKEVKIFTPEISIKTQFVINSDIVICLDDFTSPQATKTQAKETVRRTLWWAKRSKVEFNRMLKKYGLSEKNRPHLYAVVQGGYFKELRKECALGLQEIGFDGYGYGGYVVDEKGNLDLELSQYICDLLPQDKPKFALGIGRPKDIVNLSMMGWDIFDCTLPTRDARHKRLYSLEGKPAKAKDLTKPSAFSYIYIDKKIYEHDQKPISASCSCHTCQNFSRAYLRHLFKIGDTLAYRLATIHNIATYSRVIEILRTN